VDEYLRKSGKIENTVGRKCLCNALMANIGMAQKQASGYLEKPLFTSGSELSLLKRFISQEKKSYSAEEIINALCPQLEPVGA
jgi:nitronate monooxygenase